MTTYVSDGYNYFKFEYKFCADISLKANWNSINKLCRKAWSEEIYEFWKSEQKN
jgi:hypothetical protein